MSRSQVMRGKVFEREIANHLTTALDIPVYRTAATQQIADRTRGHADLLLPGLAPELKRTNRLSLEEAMAQAIKNAMNDELPVVITRRDRISTGEARVIMRLDDWLHLYRAWLTQEGVLK